MLYVSVTIESIQVLNNFETISGRYFMQIFTKFRLLVKRSKSYSYLLDRQIAIYIYI